MRGSNRIDLEKLKMHERLIAFVARPFASQRCPIADLMQEGRLALLTASRTWRADNGATLWTYASRFVYGAVSKYAERELKAPSRPRDRHDQGQGLYGAYSVLLEMPDADAQSPEAAAETTEARALVSNDSSLTDRERQVLALRFVEGLDVRDTASRMGLPRSTTSDIQGAAIAKLRAALTS